LRSAQAQCCLILQGRTVQLPFAKDITNGKAVFSARITMNVKLA